MKKILVTGFLLNLIFLASCSDESEKMDDQGQHQGIISAFVNQHNVYRSEVGVSDIEWSEELAESAQAWADELSIDCDFEHSSSGYGENLWMGTSDAFTIIEVVDSWGSEKEDYDYDSNSCSSVCGHYTQIVWANTNKLGCGTVTCNGFDIWVCQYDPPGNYVGERPY